MAMEHKQIDFALAETDDIKTLPVWNERAEVPILIDVDTVVCNSPDILAYLDRRYPTRLLYPSESRRYADVREWERLADTALDAVVTVIGNWKFADLPPMPAGLMDSAVRDATTIYDRLQEKLVSREFICTEISAADFAFYPLVASGTALGLRLDGTRHADVVRWLKAMKSSPAGQSDLASVRAWWANPQAHQADTQRINWGTFRLEWLLANGQADWFAQQVRQGKVLWSVGRNNNALNSPLAPAWARDRA